MTLRGDGDLLADSHSILNSWKNYFSQLLNVHRVHDVRQIEVHTVDPLLPNPSPFEVEIAIVKLKRYKSLGSDQISAELIQAGNEILHYKIHKLINSDLVHPGPSHWQYYERLSTPSSVTDTCCFFIAMILDVCIDIDQSHCNSGFRLYRYILLKMCSDRNM
jgi:hypothetical protein